MNTFNVEYKPTPNATDRRVTVSSSAITLNGDTSAPTFNEHTKVIVWDVQGGSISVTFDGSDPLTNDGHLITAGMNGRWAVQAAYKVKMIAESTDATIHASEFTI